MSTARDNGNQATTPYPWLYFRHPPPRVVNTYEPFRVVLETNLPASTRLDLSVTRRTKFAYPDGPEVDGIPVSGRLDAVRDEASGDFIFPDLMVGERDISTRHGVTVKMITSFRLYNRRAKQSFGKVRMLFAQVVPNPRLPDLLANALLQVQALGLSREQIDTAVAAAHARRSSNGHGSVPPASGYTLQGKSTVHTSQPLAGGHGQGQQPFTALTQIQPYANGLGPAAIPLPQTQGFVLQPRVYVNAEGQQVVWAIQTQAASHNEQGQSLAWVLQPQSAGAGAQGQPASWTLQPQANPTAATAWNGQSFAQAPQPQGSGDNRQGSSSVYRAPEAPM